MLPDGQWSSLSQNGWLINCLLCPLFPIAQLELIVFLHGRWWAREGQNSIKGISWARLSNTTLRFWCHIQPRPLYKIGPKPKCFQTLKFFVLNSSAILVFYQEKLLTAKMQQVFTKLIFELELERDLYFIFREIYISISPLHFSNTIRKILLQLWHNTFKIIFKEY